MKKRKMKKRRIILKEMKKRMKKRKIKKSTNKRRWKKKHIIHKRSKRWVYTERMKKQKKFKTKNEEG